MDRRFEYRQFCRVAEWSGHQDTSVVHEENGLNVYAINGEPLIVQGRFLNLDGTKIGDVRVLGSNNHEIGINRFFEELRIGAQAS